VVGGVHPGELPHPCPRQRAGPVDRGQHPRHVLGQRRDRARGSRVGSDLAEHHRLGPHDGQVRAGVPAQGQRERQVHQHLGRVVGRKRRPPPRQLGAQRRVQARGPHRGGQQHPTSLTDCCAGLRVDAGPRVETGNLLHLEGAPRTVLIWTSTIHIIPGQEHFSRHRHALGMKSRGKRAIVDGALGAGKTPVSASPPASRSDPRAGPGAHRVRGRPLRGGGADASRHEPTAPVRPLRPAGCVTSGSSRQ